MRPSKIRRPPGPARVTLNPFSLFRYMRRMQRGALQRVQERFERYGDLYFAPFLDREVYVLRHPADIHEVLVAQASKFEKPRVGLTARQLKRLLGDGLLNSNGELWRRQRRLIQPAFRKERLEEYASLILTQTGAMLETWQDGARIDASREMMELTLRIVCKALFDHEVTNETDSVATAMRVFRRAFGKIDAVLPDWLPTPSKRHTSKMLTEIDALLYGLIDRPQLTEGRDLLSVLSRAVDETGDGMSRKQLRDELLTLFLAGHETTAHALSWTWHLLATHPEIERKVQDELDQVLDGRPPSLSDLPKLTYLEQVLCESMRLFPPAYVLARVASEDAVLSGYTVPKGADVVIWVYHAHHDARWFPDPERFDPERFAPAQRKQIPASAYVPFGAGTRSCIGKQFAMMEALLVLVCVARRCSLESVSGPVVAPDAAVTLAPRDGLHLRVRNRRVHEDPMDGVSRARSVDSPR